MKKRVLIFMILIMLTFIISGKAFASDNVDTGDGGSSAYKYGFYRTSEWAWKVSIYVAKTDQVSTSSQIDNLIQIGQPIYIRPNFQMPSNTYFANNNKVDYIGGANLANASSWATIIDSNTPRPPVTHNGNLNTVKSFFGDTKTLEAVLNKLAITQGTSKEGLVANISFSINGVDGLKNPEDILPMKGGDGKYKNQVGWLIVYEPVAIAHLKDKKTRLAFTATEYALAQKQGLFNFHTSGADAQWISVMTHANLPNSTVLERDWFGFKAYTPLGYNVNWSNDRIIQGGGWGMRFLKPNASETVVEPPGLEGEEYRTDTDVVVSFNIQAGIIPSPGCGKQSPSKVPKHLVRLLVNGKGINESKIQEVWLPSGASQLVWIKFHTPKEPASLTVTAQVISQGEGGSWISGASSKIINTVDLNQYEPPDPRAEDLGTKKPIIKPSSFKIISAPLKIKALTNQWHEYTPAWWVEDWVWHSKWVWVSDWIEDEEGKEYDDGYWRDDGWWCDHGWWEFYANHYSANISVLNEVRPDEKVPTAKKQYNKWIMGSGYGFNIDSTITVSHNARSSDVAKQGNVINLFPEFAYKDFLRLSERISDGKFELQKNRFSTFNNRVHFTPLWYPDTKYEVHTELVDIWTPAGHLKTYQNADITIKGSVMNDWQIVPSKGF